MEEQNPKKEELDLLYEDDLLPVLEKLGVSEKFFAGNLKCASCKESVNQENLGAFYLENSELQLVCNKPGCIKQIGKHG